MGKRIIIAGGGTGGHIFRAIAIANALREKDSSIEILFLGAKGKMEMEKVPHEEILQDLEAASSCIAKHGPLLTWPASTSES